jgi:acyl-CoA thioester hydrolase
VARLRVSYGETDRMGVVYYGNYLRYFEMGRAEYLRGRGRSYRQIEEGGIKMPVVEVHAQYHHAAAYDDELQISARLLEADPVRIRFGYRVERQPDGLLLAEGYTVHVCVGDRGRIRRFPPELLALVQGRST